MTDAPDNAAPAMMGARRDEIELNPLIALGGCVRSDAVCGPVASVLSSLPARNAASRSSRAVPIVELGV